MPKLVYRSNNGMVSVWRPKGLMEWSGVFLSIAAIAAFVRNDASVALQLFTLALVCELHAKIDDLP